MRGNMFRSVLDPSDSNKQKFENEAVHNKQVITENLQAYEAA